MSKRIMVFGCQKIALNIIDFISKSQEADLIAVVTCDEERDKIFADEYVEEYCNKNNIPNIRFNNKPDIEYVKQCDPDIIFSIYYRKILSREIVNYPKMGCINVHPGYLENDRGPNPTLYNVLRGDKYASSTIHYMDDGVDSGDIIDQMCIEIDGRTGFELNRDIMALGYDIFRNNYRNIIYGTNSRKKQDNTLATYNPPFHNNMRYIDWSQPYDKIKNHIRAFKYPYGGSVACTRKFDIIVKDIERSKKNRVLNGIGFY